MFQNNFRTGRLEWGPKKGFFFKVINTSNDTQQELKNRRKCILGLILAGILLVDTFDTL